MDDVRDSFSRFKKDVKHRLGRSKRKGDKPGAGGREESVGSSSLVPQPESHVSTGGGGELDGGEPNAGNENVGASATDWKSTASSSAKLVLRAVRDSADAFGPLKSVAGGLCFILENCEVRYLLLSASSNTYASTANKGKRTGDRVVGTSGQRACRSALQARSRGRCRRRRKENETGTVSAYPSQKS